MQSKQGGKQKGGQIVNRAIDKNRRQCGLFEVTQSTCLFLWVRKGKYMEKDYNEAVIGFFYDVYFKGREGHDYTDEQIAMSVTKMDIDKCVETARDALYEHFDINPGTNYVISEETKKRLEKFLYRELEVDSTSVEINELLDLLEGTKKR